jgi:transaldolase
VWLDNIARSLLVSGTLQRYLRDFAVTGITSNPTIFEHAIRNKRFYDEAAQGKTSESLFFDLERFDVGSMRLGAYQSRKTNLAGVFDHE